ncbi:MAG: PAS domain-containing protein [Bacteroidota bacterium]
MSSENTDHYFLKGGGEMGELIRAKDWSKTSLGDPADWPQSLRTMVAVMLDNPFGMYIAWGSEYTQLYNDGYRPILGATKHPQALGISTRETFSEIWHIIESMFDGVMNGKAVGFPDFMLPLNRYGYEEECYFDFSYSPIRKDNGEVGGVLVTVIETTEKKRATEALKESNARYINNIVQAPVAMCIFRGESHVVEIVNEKMLAIWGKRPEQVIHRPIFEGLPEAKDQGLEELLETVYKTGEKYVANERPVNLPRNGKLETTYVNFVYDAVKEADGTISGIVAIAIEVTPQVTARSKVEASEQKVRALVENAPFPIAVYVGKEMIVELANQSIIDLWGKGNDVIGKSFREVLPELDNQLVFEQIEKVLTTGESFHTKNTPLDLVVEGKPRTFYFNYSFTPLYDLSGNIYGVMNTGVDLTELNIAKKRIEESDKRFRNTVKQAPVGITILRGPEYIVEMANDAYLQLVDRKEAIFVGKPLFDGLPEVRETVQSLLDGVLNSGVPYHGYEVAVPLNRYGKQEIYYFDFHYHPLKEQDGKISGVIVTVTEVTEKVEARKIIEDSKRLYEAITQNTPDLIYVFGLDYRFTYANTALLAMWGRTWEDAIGKSMIEIGYEPWHAEMHMREIDQVIATKKTIRGEVSFPHATLGRRIYDYIFAPVFDQDTNVVAIAGTTRDVTQLVEARKQIEESEQNIRSMVLQSPIGICVMDADTLVSEIVNDSFIEIAGKNYDEIAGKHYWDTFAEARPYYESALNKVIAEGESFFANEVEMMLIRHGKEDIIYVTFVYAPLKNIEGTVKKVAVWVLDNTPQVNARRKIEEADKRFRNTVKQAPVGITILRGPQYVVEMANDAYLRLVDRKEDAFIGQALFDVLPEVRESVHALLDSVLFTGVPYHGYEVPIPINRYGKQEINYFDFLYHPLKEEDGKISGVIVTVTEVSEKVQARKKIEESEKRFRSLAESLPQLIWETDDKGNALYASGRWKEYTGVTPMGEAAWKAVIHPDDFDENAKTWMHSLATGDLYGFDVRIKSKAGDYRWHRVIGEPVFDKENKIIKWVGAFTDIHTEKAFTQELEKQVAERTRELGDTNIELEKMNKELQTFAYISSHDLQEPLRKIQTFSSQIVAKESQNLSDGGKDKFRRMQSAAKRMQTLIDDLLTYSRTNTQERKFEKTDLKSIVEEVKEDLKEELQQKHATVAVGDMCEAHIIPFQFRQLLFNLLSNSLKFSNPAVPPLIEIKSEIAEGSKLNNQKLENEVRYCHISVSDNGIGFEQQYSEKIFQVFQRLHTKNEYEGTGIGLSIVKKIVENHFGIITAKGELNKGVTFDIYIPET